MPNGFPLDTEHPLTLKLLLFRDYLLNSITDKVRARGSRTLVRDWGFFDQRPFELVNIKKVLLLPRRVDVEEAGGIHIEGFAWYDK